MFDWLDKITTFLEIVALVVLAISLGPILGSIARIIQAMAVILETTVMTISPAIQNILTGVSNAITWYFTELKDGAVNIFQSLPAVVFCITMFFTTVIGTQVHYRNLNKDIENSLKSGLSGKDTLILQLEEKLKAKQKELDRKRC